MTEDELLRSLAGAHRALSAEPGAEPRDRPAPRSRGRHRARRARWKPGSEAREPQHADHGDARVG